MHCLLHARKHTHICTHIHTAYTCSQWGWCETWSGQYWATLSEQGCSCFAGQSVSARLLLCLNTRTNVHACTQRAKGHRALKLGCKDSFKASSNLYIFVKRPKNKIQNIYIILSLCVQIWTYTYIWICQVLDKLKITTTTHFFYYSFSQRQGMHQNKSVDFLLFYLM